MKIDMHVHSKEGFVCANISVKTVVKELKKRKINGMLLTDHHSIEGYKEYKKNMQ